MDGSGVGGLELLLLDLVCNYGSDSVAPLAVNKFIWRSPAKKPCEEVGQFRCFDVVEDIGCGVVCPRLQVDADDFVCVGEFHRWHEPDRNWIIVEG